MICTCDGCKKLWAEEAELQRNKPVTITISREDAEALQDPDGNWVDGSTERLAGACRAALEGR